MIKTGSIQNAYGCRRFLGGASEVEKDGWSRMLQRRLMNPWPCRLYWKALRPGAGVFADGARARQGSGARKATAARHGAAAKLTARRGCRKCNMKFSGSGGIWHKATDWLLLQRRLPLVAVPAARDCAAHGRRCPRGHEQQPCISRRLLLRPPQQKDDGQESPTYKLRH